jgi:hypothetical protein
MPWPTPQDYNEAVQNPRLAFIDPDLRNGHPELTRLGLPRPISGNFACVYKIQSGSQRWAARCFLTEVSDQQQRYEALSTYLAKAALSYTVGFSYLPAGIKVQGRHYPLLKMQWVQGESLNGFLAKSVGYPDTLLSLAKVWARMIADLKTAGIAHGDLQHGNVVVVGDQVRLIDYDGMFVPTLAGKQSNECGHRNYQLPCRAGRDYGPYLDNFSAWVIYVSLVALAVHPELWNTHRGGDECLIFRKEDFLQPERSAILSELNSSPNPQLRFLTGLFTSLFSLAPQDIPSLDGNLATATVFAASGPNAAQLNANWWTDHVEIPPSKEERLLDANRLKEEDTSIPDPGRIVDSLMDYKAVQPLAFQGGAKEVRIVIAGSAALIVLTRLLVQIPASEFLAVTCCIFGLNLLFCFIRYRHDSTLTEFGEFREESRNFVRQVREHQTLLDSISAERRLLQEKVAKSERHIADRKKCLLVSLQAKLNEAQAECDSQLKRVAQRRRDIASSEPNKLNAIHAKLGNQISEIDRKISGLNQMELDETNKAAATLQDHRIQSYLRSYSVASCRISGIGTTYKRRLISQGFVTAANIDLTIKKVQGIGSIRQAALLRWRQGLEKKARKSVPGLSSNEQMAIKNKYRQERQSLESAKQSRTEFNNQVTNARQYFAGARQSLNQEEQQLCAANVQKKAGIEQKHNAQIAILDRNAALVRNQATPTINELVEGLRAAQKQVFALRWESAKHEKEGQRFAAVQFSDYLRSIIST